MIDKTTYRNLALRRAAFHSSSYDYNLAASLVTDGIKDTALPRWVAVATSDGGVIGKVDREFLLDDNVTSSTNLRGAKAWIQVQLGGGDSQWEVDRIEVVPRTGGGGGGRGQTQPPGGGGGWTCTVSGSDDGQGWKQLGSVSGTDRPMGPQFRPSLAFAAPSRSRYYRVEFTGPEDRSGASPSCSTSTGRHA